MDNRNVETSVARPFGRVLATEISAEDAGFSPNKNFMSLPSGGALRDLPDFAGISSMY